MEKFINSAELELLHQLPPHLQSISHGEKQLHIPRLLQIFMQNDDRNYHVDDFAIFAFCLSGKKRVDSGNIHLELHRGEAVILPPDQRHLFHPAQEHSAVLLFTFYPHADPALSQISNTVFSIRGSERKLLFESLRTFIRFHRRSICGEDPGLYFILALNSIRRRLLPESSTANTANHNDKEALIARVSALIHANLHRQITQAEMAKYLNISVSSLRKLFREKLHINVGAYVLDRRLTHAIKLLRSTDMTIAEIAMATGFSTDVTFRRAFHRKIGLPPLAFRKITRNGELPGVKLRSNGYPVFPADSGGSQGQ